MSRMDRNYEDEIRDLLEKMDRFVRDEPRTARARRRAGGFGEQIRSRLRGFGLGRRLAGLRSGQQLVLLGILLVVIALFVRVLIPPLGVLIGIAGVALFIVGYVLALTGLGGGRQETRWRGRIIEMPRRRPLWWVVLARLLRRR